jgi:hypothetical protein
MAFVDLKVNTMFGMPLSAKPVGMSIDVRRNIITPFHMTGDKNVENVFMSQSGMYSSAMEHIIFEWMFNVKAVSAVKVLQQANTLSIPVYIVTSQNIGQILPVLQVSDLVKTDVQNAVNAGLQVIVPQTEIILNNWRGTGYIVQNPDTLSGAYKISGGINGGSTSDGTFNYMNDCSITGDWGILLEDVDALLTLSDALLLGQVGLQGFADELCVLLQGIDPNASDPLFAKESLDQFSNDVVAMVYAISGTQMSLWTGSGSVVRWVALQIWNAILTGSWPGSSIPKLYRYSGYFILHYLYEYIALFRAGLLDAFPKF